MKKKLLICLLLTVICFWHFNVKAEGIAEAITEDAVASEVISNEEIVGTESETEEESDEESDDETEEESELETDEETGTDEEELVEEKEEDTTDETEKEEETTEEEVTTTDDVEEENNEEGNTEILEEVEEENENYEVTFSHGEYRLSIKGGSSILLSKLAKKLGINISMSDIGEITISNEEVLKIVNVENSNDFVIQSLKSFDTEEELIIKLKDGREIIIKVVDPVGDTPKHDKELTDNGDGTYTISLTVKGDAEKQVNKVNVIVVLDTSGSMDENTGNGEITYTATNTNGDNLYGLVNGEYVSLTRYGNGNNSRYYYNGYTRYYGTRYLRTDTSQDRLEAAQEAVNGLAEALLSNNGVDGNPTDTVEIALIDFNTHATTRVAKTTSYSTFSSAVNALDHDGGTNWEAALAAANNINFGDSDQIYIIFVSDGNPTFRDSANGNNNDRNYTYNVYGTGQEQTENITRAYNAALDDARAIVNGGKKFYTIGAYGNVDRMENLTTEAGAPARNYYSAENTAALQEALGAILSEIEMAGIGAVSINDGTTNSVTTSSGVSHLLDVDTNSFKYYKDGEEWTDAPEATLNSNGEVVWDLSEEGVLENGVTYKVTFVVWPSQTTLDLIADLKNYPNKYDTLDANIKKYLVKDGDGYTLLTNTTASLSFKDTREENPQTHTSTYTNPEPVSTIATQLLTIAKEWNNDIDEREKREVEIAVLKDGESWDSVTLNSSNNWEDGRAIAVGIITFDDNGKYIVRANGHDFSFGELGDEAYNWELKSEVVHPMLIKGDLTILIRYGTEAPTEGTYYKIGNYYYVVGDLEEAKLTATNERRSWIDLEKTVNYSDNAAHFDDQIFTFDITVGETGGEDVWFSIMDKTTEALIKLADDLGLTVTGATAEVKNGEDTGYFYATSGSTFTVGIKTGWNLRIINLLTGTPYTIEEKNIDSKFEFKDITYLPTTDSEGVAYTPTINKTNYSVSGEIQKTNTKYGYTFINKNVNTEIVVTKVWKDNDDVNKNRPSNIVLNLSDGTTVIAQPTKVENENGTWTYTYTGLPVYDENEKLIEYKLTEDAITGYTTVITGDAKEGFTVTNTLETTSVTVNKDWQDNNNQDGLRPTTITLTLSNGDTVELTKEGNWTATVNNLPKYKNGSLVTYTVTEETVPEGYQVTYSEDGLTAINTHTPATKSLVVKKVWDDNSDQDGKRPENVKFTVTGSDGNEYTATLSGNGNEWTATIEKVAVYYDGGKTVTFEVTEDTVTGYTPSIDNEKLTITNSYTPEKADVVVTKKWSDENNKEGLRPGTITIHLLANGEEVSATPTIAKDGNTWTFTYSKLDVNAGGSAITYTVTEDTVTNYETDIDNEKLIITNSRKVENIELTVKKVWDDNDNQDGKRPVSLTVTLNDADKTEATLNADNQWTATIKVQKYIDGEVFKYSWTEDEVDDYELTGTKIQDNVTTFTNTHEPKKADVVVTKKWSDENNKEGLRPGTITIHLLANGEEVSATPTIAKDGNTWTFTYSKLDVNAGGSAITYTVTEDTVTNYETDIDNEKLIITNTHEVEPVTITIKKIWVDDNDRDGIRLRKLVITIMKTIDGTKEKVKVKDIELNDGNKWTETIKDLLEYEDGKKVTYTAEEKNVPEGYKVSYSEDTFTITNTHEIETKDIVVTKVWDDEDNESGKRPESVTIILLADGEECGRIELSSDNDWTHPFEGMPVNDEDHKEITYSVSEEIVPKDYEVAYEETKDGFIIHNVLGKGDGNPPENPQTGSNIVLYLIALLIGIIGLIGGKHYLKENN